MIPYPDTITSLCFLGGVEAEWEKEETYPRASPLTLTGVTNGPKSRGKGKEKDMEGERGSERCHKLAQWESSSQRQQELQGSPSPILNAPLELRQNHQEQVGCSRHQCNNAELMEVLRSMKQEMKERDNQLKLQLQLGDEYMKAKLRGRDQNMEDALKKRDEEWRAELEKRDQYWLNSMGHYKKIFQLMTYEQINNRAFLESLAKRQRELTESNAKFWTGL